MSKENGGPAFPKAALDPWGKTTVFDTGMSLRDYFAAKALQGVISAEGLGFMGWHPSSYDDRAKIASAAYLFADAMLAERAQ